MAGLAITGYKYALSTSADNVTYSSYGSYVNSSWTSGTTFTITGLTNGTYYKVKIRAVNSLGDGAESAEIGPLKPFKVPDGSTNTGSDATTTPSAPTTNSPSNLQTFATAGGANAASWTSGSGTWTNPYPSGATTGTGTLNGSSSTTHFVWGTSSGSYPNEVAATSNAYVKTTWARGTTVYYKARVYNTACAVTFNGTVNSNGDSTTVTFEYGTSSGVYPSSVSAGTVTALTSTAVTATVSNLAAGTYYYRVKAVNAAGTTYGTQQSIAISAKSATAASEQSFTPPYVGTLYNILVVGGGGGPGGDGAGGGGVAASNSAAAPSSLGYAVGNGASTYFSNGGNSTLSGVSINMTATGGAQPAGWNGSASFGGASGTGSGGANVNTQSYSPSGGYALGDENPSGGGGGGAGGNATDGTFRPSSYTIGGCNGGPGVSVYGLTLGSGGGGVDGTPEYGPNHGVTPFSNYGGGGSLSGGGNYRFPAQSGIISFYWYGP